MARDRARRRRTFHAFIEDTNSQGYHIGKPVLSDELLELTDAVVSQKARA